MDLISLAFVFSLVVMRYVRHMKISISMIHLRRTYDFAIVSPRYHEFLRQNLQHLEDVHAMVMKKIVMVTDHYFQNDFDTI